MPLYQFECKQCAKTFDEKETFEEHDRHREVKCPLCGSSHVVQAPLPVGVKTAKKS